MRPVAVIDIGSNSMCLVVAVRLRNGTLATVAKHKHAARLRDAVGSDGNLTHDGMQRGLLALREFAAVLANWNVCRVRAVATAALRAAANGTEFIAAAREQTKIEVEIIDGDEEARLAYLGVCNGLSEAASATILCADVGGGSSELLVGRAGHIIGSVSMAVGALVVSRELLGADPVGIDKVAAAKAELLRTLSPEAVRLVGQKVDCAVATSGTIQRVARIAHALAGRSVENVHRAVITRAQLAMVIEALATAETQESRLRIPAMDPLRADNLLGGALIFETVAELFDFPEWVVSMDGLRMGVLAELAGSLESA